MKQAIKKALGPPPYVSWPMNKSWAVVRARHGVSLEDREDLLGHKSNRITTHYSRAEINNLIDAVEKIVENKPQHTFLRVVESRVIWNERA